MNRRYASYMEKRTLEDQLIQRSTPIGDNDKERQWEEGWDFKRVASASNHLLNLNGGENLDLNHNHVRHIVKELGITMHDYRPGTMPSDLEKRVAALERNIEEILNRLDAAGA